MNPLFPPNWHERVREWLASLQTAPLAGTASSDGEWAFYRVETPGQPRPFADDTHGTFVIGNTVLHFLEQNAGQAGGSAFVWADKNVFSSPLYFWAGAMLLYSSSQSSFAEFWFDFRVSPSAQKYVPPSPAFAVSSLPLCAYIDPLYNPAHSSALPLGEEPVQQVWELNKVENAILDAFELLFETSTHYCWWQWHFN